MSLRCLGPSLLMSVPATLPHQPCPAPASLSDLPRSCFEAARSTPVKSACSRFEKFPMVEPVWSVCWSSGTRRHYPSPYQAVWGRPVAGWSCSKRRQQRPVLGPAGRLVRWGRSCRAVRAAGAGSSRTRVRCDRAPGNGRGSSPRRWRRVRCPVRSRVPAGHAIRYFGRHSRVRWACAVAPSGLPSS